MKRKLLDLMHANRNVDAQDELAAQVRAFGELGLDYHAALDALNSVLGEIGLGSYDERDGMASQHWLLFSGIGLKCDIKTILEIGTFNGRTTALIGRLFPAAQIYTVDLPDDSPYFNNSYGRADDAIRREFLETRQKNLTRAPNVTFVQDNSFNLPNHFADMKFDLIWVDGSHDYPALAWDMFFTVHHLAPGGWLMADDFNLNQGARHLHERNDCKRLIDYLAIDRLISPRFIRKRIPRARTSVADKHVLVLRQ